MEILQKATKISLVLKNSQTVAENCRKCMLSVFGEDNFKKDCSTSVNPSHQLRFQKFLKKLAKGETNSHIVCSLTNT